MTTLVLSQEEVRELLDMEACMECVADSLRALSSGEAQNPLRWPMFLPQDRSGHERILGLMPGSMQLPEAPEAIGLKVVTVYPGNHGTRYDSHQGVVMLFDPEHGYPMAIFDGSEITAIRTAAASGVATRVLAREDASVLALIGSGVQARTHLEAMRVARTIESVRVFSPTVHNRDAFAARESERHAIPVSAVSSARAAVEGADIVCTTTASSEPVVEGSWLAEGTHINAVGACTPRARELDREAVERARVFVDCRESAEKEAGDLILPDLLGRIRGEIGELLLGTSAGRQSDADITLFESLGVAVEDLATAVHLAERAAARGVGTRVALGGMRDA